MRPHLFQRLIRCVSLLATFFAGDCALLAGDYTQKIEPILAEHCYDCHGEDKQKSKLRIDTVEGILRGGDSGEPFVVAGDSSASYLMSRVTSDDPEHQMPPKGERISEQETAVLRAWIDGGAKLLEH